MTVTTLEAGVVPLQATIRRIRQEAPASIAVATGDLFLTPITLEPFGGEAHIELLNAIGLDVAGLSASDMEDRSPDEFVRLQQGGCDSGRTRGEETCVRGAFNGAKFQLLNANVMSLSSDRNLLPGFAVKTLSVNGASVKVGIVAVVDRDTLKDPSSFNFGRVRLRDEAATANEIAAHFRETGVQLAILLTSQYLMPDFRDTSTECASLRTPGRSSLPGTVDRLDPIFTVVIASGRTPTVCLIGGRTVVTAGSAPGSLSLIDFEIGTLRGGAQAPAVKHVVATTSEAELATDILGAAAHIEEALKQYEAAAARKQRRRVGRVLAPITRAENASRESPLGRMIADAQLAATRAYGAELAIVNAGGVRDDLGVSLESTAAYHDVDWLDILRIQPFGNRIVTVTLSGAEILEGLTDALIGPPNRVAQMSQGSYFCWNLKEDRPAIYDVRINGRPLVLGRQYRVTFNNFLYSGGDNFSAFKNGRDPVTSLDDVDALSAFIESRTPIAASTSPRICTQ